MSTVKNPGEGVCYTAKGHWKPTIPGAVCKHCGCTFTAHKKDPQYCSRSCAAKATAKTVPHTERTCPGCNKVWSAAPSNPSQYCSKRCIFESGSWKRPKRRKCGSCCKTFSAKWRTHHSSFEKFCSHACASKAAIKRLTRTCANCGESFEVQPSRAGEETCSKECSHSYYLRDRHHAWKGGKVLQSDRLYRRIDRDGYAGKYEGEHRLIAAREIGRPLVRGEAIICLDGDNENLSPDNLFLCPNLKEFGMIRQGAVAWPNASNLRQMRETGYVRPDVVLTLHEWENGTRREHEAGKPITRHPQADEIIARRKAGATARELADEFSTAPSTMASILKRRL